MLLMGMDGGGTKTDIAACDETGRVLRRVLGPATNPSGESPGRLREAFHQMLKALLSGFGGLDAAVDGCYAGIAGCGLPENALTMRSMLSALLPGARNLLCGSDAISALSSGVGDGDGVVAVVGTGSNIVARKGGALRRVGGWGYLLGDEGSGYALGRMALTAALRAHDGRGRVTCLTRLCAEKLGEEVHACVPRLYAGGRAFIASFAPCVAEAASAGDAVACALIAEAAEALSEAIRTASARIGLPVPVVLAGGVWQTGGLLEQTVQRSLGEGYRFIRPSLPPVYGSVLEAARQAGITPPAGFTANFAESIDKGAIQL